MNKHDRPTWTVFYGLRNSCRVFLAEHLAEQFYRALLLNGTEARLVNTQQRSFPK